MGRWVWPFLHLCSGALSQTGGSLPVVCEAPVACCCVLRPLHKASPAQKVEGFVSFSHRGFGLHADLSCLSSIVLVLHFESVNSDAPSVRPSHLVHFCHLGQQIPSFSEESKLYNHRV